jgi:PAS domain S-box-containing protein
MDREYADLLDESAEELYEHAPTGYLSSLLDGTVVKANATLLGWIGRERDELVGGRIHDLLAPGARIYYETHYAPLLQMQGSVREVAVELLRADGRRLPVLLSSTVVADAEGRPRLVRTTVFDASERRRYERELLRARADAETRARATLALAHVNEGVLLVDPDGRLQLLNAAAESIFGVDAAAAEGRPAADALAGWAEVAARAPVGRTGERPAAVTLPTARGGREQWLAVSGIDSGDGVVYTVADVTADRRLEQRRSDLVAIVSHELRTPLTGAYGAASTLLARWEDLDDASRRQLLELTVDQAARLGTIVDQILVTSRLDNGNLPTAEEAFAATEVCDAVVQTVPAAEHGRLVVDADPALRICGDLDRLRQVVGNLVENALKYSSGPVRLTAASRGLSARFTVADDGPGIPLAEHGRIFEKFYRLDPDQHGGVGGTGLGLYIARELVTRMNGRVGLLPRERGTAFFVDVPLASGQPRPGGGEGLADAARPG